MKSYQLLIYSIAIILITASLGCAKKGDVKSFTGHYEGTYSGDTSGTWTAEFAADGTVNAVITDDSYGEIDGLGKINPKGEFELSTKGTVSDGVDIASWTGSFSINDDICTGSGKWSSGIDYRGEWKGKRIQ